MRRHEEYIQHCGYIDAEIRESIGGILPSIGYDEQIKRDGNLSVEPPSPPPDYEVDSE